ncbi:MAG: hypothetical protein NXI24_07930 [bacterium]|nr:hypothetical protein [bacterium]
MAKILADPDRTIVGAGDHAMVVTRRHVDARGEAVSPADRARQNGGEPGQNPLNPLEKASRSELSQAEQDVVRELKERDRDVRLHEQKHMAAAGDLAKGGPRYHYQVGPDGKPYAVGGEVRIDTSTVSGDPEANRHKAERVRRAALAPGDASGPDLAAANSAQNQIAGVGAEYQRNSRDHAPRNELRLYA